jgi:DNA-directed RNA polymerase subunit RPC12/RpoP
MQAQLLCATCATPLEFKVPELTGNRWHARCDSCGARTALEALPTKPEELANFSATGIYSSP